MQSLPLCPTCCWQGIPRARQACELRTIPPMEWEYCALPHRPRQQPSNIQFSSARRSTYRPIIHRSGDICCCIEIRIANVSCNSLYSPENPLFLVTIVVTSAPKFRDERAKKCRRAAENARKIRTGMTVIACSRISGPACRLHLHLRVILRCSCLCTLLLCPGRTQNRAVFLFRGRSIRYLHFSCGTTDTASSGLARLIRAGFAEDHTVALAGAC